MVEAPSMLNTDKMRRMPILPIDGVHMTTNKILIIDDDEQMRDILARFLMSVGFEPEVYEGASIVTDESFFSANVVLLDIMMPELDGLSYIERLAPEILQRKARGEKTPAILFVTAFGKKINGEDGLKLRELGVKALIKKPLELDEIRETVSRYL